MFRSGGSAQGSSLGGDDGTPSASSLTTITPRTSRFAVYAARPAEPSRESATADEDHGAAVIERS